MFVFSGAVMAEEPMEAQESIENGEHTEDHQKLLDYGINSKVADELDVIYKAGILLIVLLKE